MKRDTPSTDSEAAARDAASQLPDRRPGGPRSLRARVDTARVELVRARATVAELVARDGVFGALRRVGRLAVDHAEFPLRARRRARERFCFLGWELEYTFARYNNTFRNERTVEVSIARWFLGRAPTGRMLEVGNVLAHYGFDGHEVLDRYETIEGVLNQDVLEFVPAQPYDTVVSISTLEHVGQDEKPQAPDRAIAAFEHLISLAGAEGRALVTVPIGYNAALDSALASGRLRMPIQAVLKRVDRENRWAETAFEDGFTCRYGAPFDNANAIYVGIREDVDEYPSIAGDPPHPA